MPPFNLGWLPALANRISQSDAVPIKPWALRSLAVPAFPLLKASHHRKKLKPDYWVVADHVEREATWWRIKVSQQRASTRPQMLHETTLDLPVSIKPLQAGPQGTVMNILAELWKSKVLTHRIESNEMAVVLNPYIGGWFRYLLQMANSPTI